MWCSAVPNGGGGAAAAAAAAAAIATAATVAVKAAPTPTPTRLPTNTPLHAAADAGDASAVRTLLRNGANPNSRVKRPRYDKGATALHLAARGGHLEVTLALLAAGAETSGRELRRSPGWGRGDGDGDDDGDGDSDGDGGAETRGREFHSFSSGWGEGNGDSDGDGDGDGGSDRYREGDGGGGGGKGKGKGKGEGGWRRRGEWDGDLTPLHLASAHGHVAVVRALLSAGEPTDLIASGRKVGVGLPTDGSGAGFFGERCSSDGDGSSSSDGSGSDSGGDSGGGSYGGGGGGHTPLHLASAYGHAAVVRALTEAGACVRAQGGVSDDTPLHLASASGQVEAMAALLEAGADVDAGDEIGNTALHVVADARSLEFLLAAGANPNLAAESPYGCGTPLGSYCTLIHRLETDQKVVRRATAQVQALLRHGADTGVRASREWASSSSSSSSPSASSSSCPILSCAAKNGVPGIVAALLDAGLDPNGRDREGWAPLHDAAWGNHVEVLRLLLQAGAEKNASTGRGGWTALHLACRYTSVDCVLELLRWGVDLNPKTGVDADDDFWCRDLMFGGGRVGFFKGGGKTPAEVIGLKNRAAPTPTPAPATPGPGPVPASVPLIEGAGGGGSARSVDPTEDEDEQMEVFDEETGQRDTSAAERNAIRRALRREVSWRRRRGVVLVKTRVEQHLRASDASAAAMIAVNAAAPPAAAYTAATGAATTAATAAAATAAVTAATAEIATGLPPPTGPGKESGVTGAGCRRYADEDEGVAPGSVRPLGVAFGEGSAGGEGGVKRRRPRCAGEMLAAPAGPPASVVGGGGGERVGEVGLEEAVFLRGVLEGVVDLAACEEALFRQVVMFL